IKGSDEENYLLTMEVQRDIWVHQHPMNCRDPCVRFLVTDWERIPGFGMAAQFARMCGLLAIAIIEKRAWENGFITTKENYTTKHIWTGLILRLWVSPWSYMQPITEVNGTLIGYHRKMDRRWWRAQALRYLMRFQTEYTCGLLNVARHSTFGWEAAELVHSTRISEYIEEKMQDSKSGQIIWGTERFNNSNVRRQVGNITMAVYEASLGRETSTNYPLVNFLMAAEADFFIGALGSTWCFLIDGMRNTGGR
ncbi:hypothetical protein Tco_1205028, partial [Tanacetum coccineum]